MARKKKKIAEPKFARGVQIPLYVIKSRQLRSNLLGRVKTEKEKDETPTAKKLEYLFNHNHFICYYCLKELELSEVTVDHMTPLTRGGTNLVDNLCICCSECNNGKGEMNEEEYRSLLELIKSWQDSGKYILSKLRRGSTIFIRR